MRPHCMWYILPVSEHNSTEDSLLVASSAGYNIIPANSRIEHLYSAHVLLAVESSHSIQSSMSGGC